MGSFTHDRFLKLPQTSGRAAASAHPWAASCHLLETAPSFPCRYERASAECRLSRFREPFQPCSAYHLRWKLPFRRYAVSIVLGKHLTDRARPCWVCPPFPLRGTSGLLLSSCGTCRRTGQEIDHFRSVLGIHHAFLPDCVGHLLQNVKTEKDAFVSLRKSSLANFMRLSCLSIVITSGAHSQRAFAKVTALSNSSSTGTQLHLISGSTTLNPASVNRSRRTFVDSPLQP